MCPAPIIANPQTDFNESPALAAGGLSAPSVAGGDRLVNTGKVSNPADSTREKPKRRYTSRYLAQRVMRDVLGNDWGVSYCGCRVGMKAGVRMAP